MIPVLVWFPDKRGVSLLSLEFNVFLRLSPALKFLSRKSGVPRLAPLTFVCTVREMSPKSIL